MAQFDVHLNPNSATNTAIPYYLNVQAELLDSLNTRVIVPLVREDETGKSVKGLHLKFKVKGETVVMSTAELAGLPVRALGEKVASLNSKRDEIIAALDLLLTGI
jgi:toxin CcdB